MNALSIIRSSAIVLLILSLGSCVTRRTVTQGGETVESGYVVKRPIKEAFQNGKTD